MGHGAVTCPLCRLLNPPGAVQCDCGYRFDTGERRPASPERLPRSAPKPELAQAGIVLSVCAGGLVSTLAAYLWVSTRRFGTGHLLVVFAGSVLAHALAGHWLGVHRTAYGLASMAGFMLAALAFLGYALLFSGSTTAGIFGLLAAILVVAMGVVLVGLSALLIHLLRG